VAVADNRSHAEWAAAMKKGKANDVLPRLQQHDPSPHWLPVVVVVCLLDEVAQEVGVQLQVLAIDLDPVAPPP